MTTVMAFGSFDVIHPGHYYYLTEARKLGDSFVVVVARDANIVKFKGFTPKYPEKERVEHVRSLQVADRVVLGYEEDIFEIVEEINPEIIAMGYDQRPSDGEVHAELKKRKCKASIVRIKGYKEDQYKSSKLKGQQ